VCGTGATQAINHGGRYYDKQMLAFGFAVCSASFSVYVLSTLKMQTLIFDPSNRSLIEINGKKGKQDCCTDLGR
jgi:hypothetical protein